MECVPGESCDYQTMEKRTIFRQQNISIEAFLSEGNPEVFPIQTVSKNFHCFPITSVVNGPEWLLKQGI